MLSCSWNNRFELACVRVWVRSLTRAQIKTLARLIVKACNNFNGTKRQQQQQTEFEKVEKLIWDGNNTIVGSSNDNNSKR